MRVVVIALLLICINLSANMFIAGGVFCEEYDYECKESLPIYTDEIKDNTQDTYDNLDNPPTTLNPIELVAAIVWSGLEFMGLILLAPTGITNLIGLAIPGNTAVEVAFVLGIGAAMWFIYILAIVQIIRGFTVE